MAHQKAQELLPAGSIEDPKSTYDPYEPKTCASMALFAFSGGNMASGSPLWLVLTTSVISDQPMAGDRRVVDPETRVSVTLAPDSIFFAGLVDPVNGPFQLHAQELNSLQDLVLVKGARHLGHHGLVVSHRGHGGAQLPDVTQAGCLVDKDVIQLFAQLLQRSLGRVTVRPARRGPRPGETPAWPEPAVAQPCCPLPAARAGCD